MIQYTYAWGRDVGFFPVDEGDDVYAFDETGENVGRLRIMPVDETPTDGVYYHAMHMNVHEDHRRRGIGTQMFEIAHQRYDNLRATDDRSDIGELWVQAMDDVYAPERTTPAE